MDYLSCALIFCYRLLSIMNIFFFFEFVVTGFEILSFWLRELVSVCVNSRSSMIIFC